MTDAGAATLGVTAAARALGVTVRTLHHWDAVGLVTPSHRSPSGARGYDVADLARARRVLLHRGLGLPLVEIRALLEAPRAERRRALERRRARLEAERARIDRALSAVDRLVEADADGLLLDADAQRATFGDDWRPEHVAAASERWGDSAQWAEYAERASTRSQADWQALADEVRAFEADAAEACRTGVDPASARGHALAERHRASIGAHFHCTHAMQAVLVRDLPADVVAHYEMLAPGLATWLRASVEALARAHGVDPATATWA